MTTERRCPYCQESVQPQAIICKHCQRNIGPGHTLEAAGTKLQQIGCALTLLITVPIVIIIVLASAC